jgi:hypothetical protein
MSYQLVNSVDTVQILGPSTAVEGLLCTIQSFPSGSILLRMVPLAEFNADEGQGILSSLSNAVEQILGEGTATAATGFQGLDANGLLYDAVTFTVTYTPQTPTGGDITAPVTIPVNVITADTQFGAFLSGGSAADQISATYQKLAAMSSG